MQETLYRARARHLDARRYLAEAASDLRRAPGIGTRLFRSNLIARHRRSFLGFLWLIVPALATAGTCAFLAAQRVIVTPTTVAPYPLFVLCGVCMWQVFVEALNTPMQQLNANRQIITRTRAPHEALIFAGVLMVALNAAIRVCILVALLVGFGVGLSPSILLVPLGMAALILLGLTLGLLLAPLGMLYDDVERGLTMLVGFWFFLTPIVYPGPVSGLLRLNPVTPLLDTTRSWLLSEPASHNIVLATGPTAAFLFIAWLAYRVAKPHFVSRLG